MDMNTFVRELVCNAVFLMLPLGLGIYHFLFERGAAKEPIDCTSTVSLGRSMPMWPRVILEIFLVRARSECHKIATE